MPLLRPVLRPLPRQLLPRQLLPRPHAHRAFHATPAPRFLEPTLTATHTLLTTLHTATGLPWYALIPTTAILLRAAITTPTTLYSRARALKTLALQPLVSAWQHPLARAARATTTTPHAWERATRAALRRKRSEILRRHGCQRWKAFAAPLLQLPVWVAASATLRAMTGRHGLPEWWRSGSDTAAAADAGVAATTTTATERLLPVEESFAHEGALWFPDLLEADPTALLPLAFSFLMFANVEMQAALQPSGSRGQRVLTNVLRAVPLVALPLIVDMPAALTLYWATSAAYSLVQNAVLAVVMPRPEEVVACKPKSPYAAGEEREGRAGV